MAKKSVLDLYEMKEKEEKVAWITAYDAPTASLAEKAGLEMLLVGDSVGMCIYGYGGTNEMTMPIMLAHTAAVRRAAPNTFVVGDMPFLSYQVSSEEAVRNAGAFVREAGADAVKLEGGVRVADRIRAISEAGIVVFGHIGLTPQSSGQLGGFKAQGLTVESAKDMIADAEAVQEAGAMFLLVEAVAPEVAGVIRERLSIPVYGIGAGPQTDGELIIVSDLLGIFAAFKPKFVKRYASLAEDIEKAFVAYRDEVKGGVFPGPEHVYNMRAGELEKLRAELGE
ncbi:MAG: 3-methyl-2-oxobutanoate hydroxymethyltransferase [Planctomycetota bacterium]|jgi:3-methyl-2-oxobutanoate hydroxymethyltransferase